VLAVSVTPDESEEAGQTPSLLTCAPLGHSAISAFVGFKSVMGSHRKPADGDGSLARREWFSREGHLHDKKPEVGPLAERDEVRIDLRPFSLTYFSEPHTRAIPTVRLKAPIKSTP
jgi:hypothetical protein